MRLTCAGEFALPHLLAPGAWAREALVDSFSALRTPVTFMYGESDWMARGYPPDACTHTPAFQQRPAAPSSALQRHCRCRQAAAQLLKRPRTQDWRAGRDACEVARTQACAPQALGCVLVDSAPACAAH